MKEEEVLPDIEFIDGHISYGGYLIGEDGARLSYEAAIARHGQEKVLLALALEARMEQYKSGTGPDPGTVFISYRRQPQENIVHAKKAAATLEQLGYHVQLDVKNYSSDPRAIPAFVSRIWHAETILLLHSAAFSADSERTWIREERRAALVAALHGHADIFIGRLDDSPFVDRWLEYFTAVDLTNDSNYKSALNRVFPDRQGTDIGDWQTIDSLQTDLATVNRSREADVASNVSRRLAEQLGRLDVLILPRRIAQDVANARIRLGIAKAGDHALQAAFMERVFGRRISIARFVAAKGYPQDAVRFMQPEYRATRGAMNWQAHKVAGELLELRLNLYIAARNHYRAASRLAQIAERPDEAKACALAALSCGLKNCTTDFLSIDKEVTLALARGDTVVKAVLSVCGDRSHDLAQSIDRNLRGAIPSSNVIYLSPRLTKAWLLCSSCFAGFMLHGDFRDRICACCSHTSVVSEAEARREASFRDSSASQTKVIRIKTGELLAFEVKNLAFRCPVCKYPGVIPWQILVNRSEKEQGPGCPLCGSGRLIPYPPDSLRNLKIVSDSSSS
jgi:hypothetical protein